MIFPLDIFVEIWKEWIFTKTTKQNVPYDHNWYQRQSGKVRIDNMTYYYIRGDFKLKKLHLNRFLTIIAPLILLPHLHGLLHVAFHILALTAEQE